MFVIYVYSKNEYVKEYLYHWIFKIFFIFNRRLRRKERREANMEEIFDDGFYI